MNGVNESVRNKHSDGRISRFAGGYGVFLRYLGFLAGDLDHSRSVTRPFRSFFFFLQLLFFSCSVLYIVIMFRLI